MNMILHLQHVIVVLFADVWTGTG